MKCTPWLYNSASLKYSALILQAFFAICCCSQLNAQVRNTGNVFISGNVFINTSFTNESTASYRNDGNLYLTGDFVNNQAAIVEGSGTTSFTGSALQLIDGTQSPLFHNIYYNNASGVQMNLNVGIGGTISPVAGSLYFNSHALTMGGKMDPAYTNTSAFNVTNTSDLTITGNAAAGNGLYFDAAANTIRNVTLNTGSSAVLGNALNITASDGISPQTYGSTHGTITVNGVSFSPGGFLTLKSDINGDAVVGISSGQIAGNVTVERFIPGRRAWRFMAIPFNTSTQSINQAWQDSVYNTDATLNYANNKNPSPGYGTHITYNNTAGYDYNTTTNPSIKLWNPAASTWSTSIPSTSINIASNPAYCLFVRGSRAVNLAQAASAAVDNTTLRIIGTLNTGTISKLYNTTAGNAVLIGNPYASPINILSVLSANGSSKFTQNKFWVWDPRYAGTYGVGGYITYNDSLMVPSGSSYSGGTNAQSGQAFMLEATGLGTTTSVTFNENCKVTAEANVFGIKATTLQKHPAIFTNLVLPTGELLDGVGAAFGKQYAAKVDKDDATKLWNIDENIALVRDEATLAIEARPVPSNADTLFFRLYLRQQPYALKLFSQDLPENLPAKAWLVDKYLNTQTEVNLYDTTVYNFTPNTDTNSYRNRFMLVFNREKPGSKPGIDSRVQKIKARIYPNPVSGKTFRLILDNATDGNYTLTIYNTAGRFIATRNINYTYGQNTYSVTVPAGITSGTYIVQAMNDKGIVVASIPLVISR